MTLTILYGPLFFALLITIALIALRLWKRAYQRDWESKMLHRAFRRNVQHVIRQTRSFLAIKEEDYLNEFMPAYKAYRGAWVEAVILYMGLLPHTSRETQLYGLIHRTADIINKHIDNRLAKLIEQETSA